MNVKYKFLNHTADAKFQAYGNSVEEAFRNAAEATANLMWSTKKVKPRIKRKVSITGKDREQLLVKFLEEILFLLDTDDFLLCSVKELSIKKEKADYALEAWFLGDRISDESEIFGSVKAVTYSEMIIEGNDHYLIQVVVDV
ncbi:MAG: archease [Candidatus Aminicenantes bacterium]|nr:archease [Candidatus Aminicenantes bacterium]